MSLSIPVVGVMFLDTLFIKLIMCGDFGSVSHVVSLSGLQWYWVLESEDAALICAAPIAKLIAVISTSMLLLQSSLAVNVIGCSVDVIHNFAIQSLAVKVDVIPGRCVCVITEVKAIGNYRGQCSELCGSLHGFMPISVAVT